MERVFDYPGEPVKYNPILFKIQTYKKYKFSLRELFLATLYGGFILFTKSVCSYYIISWKFFGSIYIY